MLEVAAVMRLLEEIAPPSLAEPWDNVGLLYGSPRWPVEFVLLAVDPTPAVVSQAPEDKNGLLICHHPLFFTPLRACLAESLDFIVLQALAARRLAVYAAHTNLDRSPSHSPAQALCKVFALEAGETFCEVERIATGFGCVVEFTSARALRDLLAVIEERLQPPTLCAVGDLPERIRRLALLPGAGGDGLPAARAAEVELVLTGELKHHQAIEVAFMGPPVLCSGHGETERPVLDPLAAYLRERLPEEIPILVAEEASFLLEVARRSEK